MTQAQFNLTEGERLKTEGMALVTHTTSHAWKADFRAYGIQLAETGLEFTAEDVIRVVGVPLRHRNAIGAAMNSLARELKLTKVGYRKAKRPSRHAAVVAIWQLKT